MPADRKKHIIRHEQLCETATAPLLVPSETVGGGFQSTPKDGESKLGNHQTVQPDPNLKVLMTKKQKRGLRRDSLKQRKSFYCIAKFRRERVDIRSLGLGITASSYSKSHKKRLKRKAAEQLTTDLKSMEEAITAVGNESMNITVDKITNFPFGQIGEGRDSSLTAKQRQRTLYSDILLF
ncbi:hypothetical protein Clacol_003876 [Clathrus columnatus]|uniref:Uncharacterized protein n=1 Tax=Clathrus columnatus TaxID=1419009 RepID=A0AAV5A7L5_9AGAM|nr:hypothetical protein Clacol_003876 [Clathrus columnatus]